MSWNDDVAYAMAPFKFLTLPVGCWPLQKYNTFSLVRHIICCCSLTVMVIVFYIEIYYDCGDAYMKIDNLLLFACGIMALLKLSSFRIYADNLIRNFSSAINDYLAIDNEKKRTVVRRHAFMGRMLFYGVVCTAYVTTMAFLLMPIFSIITNTQVNVSMKDSALGYPMATPCILAQINVSTMLYPFIYVLECMVLTLTTTGNLVTDALFLSITLHVCGQVELLQIEFINFGMESKNIDKDFSRLIVRHCYLMDHAELLADTISFALLMQLLISCILICIIGFQFILALKVGDVVMIFKTIMVLNTMLVQLFAYSFVGDYLKSQAEDVAQSIYCCNWFSLSTKLMRNISFVIMQSRKPVQLAGGKYFVVDLKSYMTIVKTSLSYLSVLRVMVDT